MSSKKLVGLMLLCVAAAGIGAIRSFAITEGNKEAAPAGLPADFKLPPGWTMEDMQACMAAATPGKEQKHLADGAGEWTGKTTMFMPGAPPTTSDCTSTITPLMGGRYTKVEIKGEMPGWGPFEGVGIYGFDNVTKKYVSSWIDNQGTGILNGTGELSADGKVMTWTCTANCPIAKKAITMTEIETVTGPSTKRFEMIGPDPKTGKESKMMSIEFTKKS